MRHAGRSDSHHDPGVDIEFLTLEWSLREIQPDDLAFGENRGFHMGKIAWASLPAVDKGTLHSAAYRRHLHDNKKASPTMSANHTDLQKSLWSTAEVSLLKREEVLHPVGETALGRSDR